MPKVKTLEETILRSALVGLVGADGREDLEQLRDAMREMPMSADDKVATIAALCALLVTLPTE